MDGADATLPDEFHEIVKDVEIDVGAAETAQAIEEAIREASCIGAYWLTLTEGGGFPKKLAKRLTREYASGLWLTRHGDE